MQRDRIASYDLDGTLVDDAGNIHSRECRTALTEMVMRLFELWQIPSTDQAALLNRSLGSIRRYRSGGCISDEEEMCDRVATLLRIHKNLRILYPYNRDLVYSILLRCPQFNAMHTMVTSMRQTSKFSQIFLPSC